MKMKISLYHACLGLVFFFAAGSAASQNESVSDVSTVEYSPINEVVPEYPSHPRDRAFNRGLEGYVDVKFDITIGGSVINPRIQSSTSSLFEGRSIEVVNRLRFPPNKVFGLQARVVYKLDGAYITTPLVQASALEAAAGTAVSEKGSNKNCLSGFCIGDRLPKHSDAGWTGKRSAIQRLKREYMIGLSDQDYAQLEHTLYPEHPTMTYRKAFENAPWDPMTLQLLGKVQAFCESASMALKTDDLQVLWVVAYNQDPTWQGFEIARISRSYPKPADVSSDAFRTALKASVTAKYPNANANGSGVRTKFSKKYGTLELFNPHLAWGSQSNRDGQDRYIEHPLCKRFQKRTSMDPIELE